MRGTIPPAMKTPPRAPNVSARSPATLPNMAQNMSSAALLVGQQLLVAAWTMSAALRSGTVAPSIFAIVR